MTGQRFYEPLTAEERAHFGHLVDTGGTPPEYHLAEDPSDEELGYPAEISLWEGACRQYPRLGPVVIGIALALTCGFPTVAVMLYVARAVLAWIGGAR